MAGAKYKAHDLDVELVFDRFLDEAAFDILQRPMLDLLPQWSRDLQVWRARQDKVPIDVGVPSSLGPTVTSAATERGPLYRQLVARHGPPAVERQSGSVELRGSSAALTMVISIDEVVASPLGPRTRLGNHITFQVRGATIEGRTSAEWARAAFVQLCAALQPAWASAEHPGEYWAKVMSESPSIQAVGRDFGRYLPGLFWLNGFGPAYVGLAGEQLLLATPATEVVEAGDVIVIVRGDDPRAWASAASLEAERLIIDHLGADLFFDRTEPDRAGRAPDWSAFSRAVDAGEG